MTPPSDPPRGTGILATCRQMKTRILCANPSYTYTLPGKYNAVLTARDADGCVTPVTKQIDVTRTKASFTTSGQVCPPDSVQFLDISLKTDSIKIWHWKFGDASVAPGDTSNKRNPKYLFPQPGNYLVTPESN